MRRFVVLLVALAAWSAALAAPAHAAPAPPALAQQIGAALAQARASGMTAVVDIDGIGRAVSIAPGALMPPASVEKLFTLSAALLRLGPDTRFLTVVQRDGAVANGVLQGDLIVLAKGDPSLNGPGLDDLATQVVGAGIRHVSGSIVVNDRHFDRRTSQPGWKAGFLPDESGPLSAFAVDGNAWNRSPAFLNGPAVLNGDRFRDALSRQGVAVDGATRVSATSWDAVDVAIHASPTMAELARHTLKDSDNFMAELLFKEVASRFSPRTTPTAADAMWRVLAGVGVPRGVTTDGSGLSAIDRQTAANTVALIAGMERSPAADAFNSSYPIACVDGTLKTRMCGTPGAGRVTAKTGSLPGVVSLAGTTTTASGRHVRFALFLSGVDANRGRAAVDNAAVALSAFPG
jgi:D-alanyl-D-alanine carboxypeptidase/D-alanyl-D-alanine-endopeptidase (penicillin-binding protein 4)